MTLKVLTIGAGFFAALHVEAWARNPDTTLVGLVDPDTEKAKTLSKNHAPNTQIFADANTAIQATAPDIIDIATPPNTHSDIIALADQAAPSAIICQKPFCGNLAAAQHTTNTTKTPLIVHENFRFQPWYRQIKTVLEQETLGQIYQITMRMRSGDGQGTNAYLDRQPYFQTMERFLIHETGIHWIDTFRYLMGDPTAVFADLRRLNPAINGEDAGHVLFKFDDGKRALFDANRLSDHAAENPRLTLGECMIEGEKGTITLNGFGQIHHRPKGATQATLIATDYTTTTFGGDCVYAFQKHVTDHLLLGQPLETSAKDYLKNLEIEESIYLSASTERLIKL